MNPSAGTEARTVEILDDLERARVLLDPDRRRLVEALRERPDSAAGLARRLGDSRQRLNHHLRALEGAGLVELQEERRKGNCVERVLRVVARRFVLDPGALEGTGVDDHAAGDRFSATYLIAQCSRAIRELASLRERARGERKRLATWSLDTRVELSGPADMEAFTEDLTRAVADVVARHHEPGERSRPFRLVVGSWPAPAEPAEGEMGSAEGEPRPAREG
ncbi:MAG: helix-turn-helix domain-containing protein [Gemmatimonadota bacterium]|jgi:DNA-binding transcriptional ArsR family regulator